MRGQSSNATFLLLVACIVMDGHYLECKDNYRMVLKSLNYLDLG